MYVWKILENRAPNCGISMRDTNERFGRMCNVPSINTKSRAAVITMKEQTFQVHGPKLFNSLPAYIRNMKNCSLEDFKMALDKYLQCVPDEPSVNGLTPIGITPDAKASNSLLDQIRRVHNGKQS